MALLVTVVAEAGAGKPNVEFNASSGKLVVDGEPVLGGKRREKIQYVDRLLMGCEASAPVERGRKARVTAGLVLGTGASLGTVVNMSKNPNVGVAVGLLGVAVVGLGLVVSGSSRQAAIRRYNQHCADPLQP